VAYDGSNVAGVCGGTGAADPLAAAAVTTGLELLIPLSAIGNLGGDGTGGFTGNVSGINLDSFSGEQFFVVMPEPASVSLIALMGGGIFFTRRFFRV
jgi:hypothetical protein